MGKSISAPACARGSSGKPYNQPWLARGLEMSQLTATPVLTRGFFLDGKWIEAGEALEVRSPYDQSVIGQVFRGGKDKAAAALRAAGKASGTTARRPPFVRQRV